MNVALPVTPPAYTKAWADSLTQALKTAFGQINAAGATITLPYGATLVLTAADGSRWAASIDASGVPIWTRL